MSAIIAAQNLNAKERTHFMVKAGTLQPLQP